MTSPFKSPWIYLADIDGFVLGKNGKRRPSEVQANGISPFISPNRILTAQTCIKKSERKFAGNVSNGIVDLHPSTMELCSMEYGAAILIYTPSSANKKSQISSFKVLPSMSVPPGKIAFSEDSLSLLGIEKDKYIHVCSAIEIVDTVESVQLHTKDISVLRNSYIEDYLFQVLQNRYFVQGQMIIVEYFGRNCLFRITSTGCQTGKHLEIFDNCLLDDTCNRVDDISLTDSPAEDRPVTVGKIDTPNFKAITVYQIAQKTIVKVSSNCIQPLNANNDGCIKYDMIGGLEEQIKKLKNFVEFPLNHPEIFQKSGLKPPTGVILYGSTGTGKSMLLKSCSNNINCPTVSIDVAKILSRNAVEAEEDLLKHFNLAMRSPPALILIDDLHIIYPQKDGRGDVAKRLDFALCNLLDRISAYNKANQNYVIVLTATNALENINPALRRTKRLECEIEIPIPSPSDRIEIFQKELVAYRHSLDSACIRLLGEKAHGYVGSDIATICKEAGRIALEQSLPEANTLKELRLGINDFEEALRKIPPSAIRELIVQVPKVLWTDIGGNSEVKKKLKQTVEWPLKHPEAFQRLGIDAPCGVLLYGPPGCSKTLTAKALATESGLNFISIKGPELFSKYVGDSEKAIRKIFAKAKTASPSIIFIDELDALAGERTSKSNASSNMTDRVLATLLTELDGVETRQDVTIVAATNRPDKIDKALLRPGRIDRIIHVPLPNPETRRDIMTIQFRKIPVSPSIDMDWLVEKTDRYSGAEICAICREAALAALERDMSSTALTLPDFEYAFSSVHPQTSKDVVAMYEKYAKTFLSDIK